MRLIKRWVWVIAALLCAVVASAQVQILAVDHQKALDILKQRLSLEQQTQTNLQQTLAALRKRAVLDLQKLESEHLTAKNLEQNQLTLAESQADLVSMGQSFQETSSQMQELNAALLIEEEHLQDALAKMAVIPTELHRHEVDKNKADVSYLKTYITLFHRLVNVLHSNKALQRQMVNLQEETNRQMSNWFYQHQNFQREQSLIYLANETQQKRQVWLNQEVANQAKLQLVPPEKRPHDANALNFSTLIFQAQQSIDVDQMRLRTLRLEDGMADLAEIPGKDLPTSELDWQSRYADNLIGSANTLRKRIEAKAELVQSRQKIQGQALSQGYQTQPQYLTNLQVLNALAKEVGHLHDSLTKLLASADRSAHLIKKELGEQIAKRQVLPGFDLQAWTILSEKLFQMLSYLVVEVKSLRDHTWVAHQSLSHWMTGVLATLLFGWTLACYMLRRWSSLLITKLTDKDNKLSVQFAYTILQLAKRLFWWFLFPGLLLVDFVFVGIPYKNYRLLLSLFLVWLFFRSLILIARLSLVETLSNVWGRDVTWYHRLKWTFIFGAVATTLSLLSNQLYVTYEARDVIARFFMLFLLLLSWVLYRGRYLAPDLLSLYLKTTNSYWPKAVRILAVLVPLTLLSNALVGLFGYLQLASVMSFYQVTVLCALVIYILLRGFLVDLMDVLSAWTIRNLKSGWLVSQAFLRPIDKLARLFLVAAVILTLFHFYGWTAESPIISALVYLLHYSWVFHGGELSPLSILSFVITVMVTIWASTWAKEFSFRGLFFRIRDTSLRNSLSILSQYVLVSFGVIISLRVLGIEVSGLSYIFGGLAVGLGFALRDVANNIVSGLMLLFERPVKVGDLVSIGSFEGEVMSMGIRAMTLKSWDHMEVMVPNAETFNTPLTNWTHQDSIVRTVIPIRISRDDDPVFVQALILKLLKKIPGVLEDPPANVLFKAVDEGLIELEVRYFINIEKDSRVMVRSHVLFAVWKGFKANGIKAPFPRQDITLLGAGDEVE